MRICTWCDAAVPEHMGDFCPVCGSSVKAVERRRGMVYNSIRLNENGKALVCPHCENEELTKGDYCKICGNNIINRCGDMTDPKGKNIKIRSCGAVLQGNARYCSLCGNESTFFQKGWLKDWKSENTKKAIFNINNPDNAISFREIKEEKAK